MQKHCFKFVIITQRNLIIGGYNWRSKLIVGAANVICSEATWLPLIKIAFSCFNQLVFIIELFESNDSKPIFNGLSICFYITGNMSILPWYFKNKNVELLTNDDYFKAELVLTPGDKVWNIHIQGNLLAFMIYNFSTGRNPSYIEK